MQNSHDADFGGHIVERSARGAPIVMTTSSGIVTGSLVRYSSFCMLPGSAAFQEVFMARVDTSLSPGDCGCWVYNSQTGGLFGHVVAASSGNCLITVMPARDLLRDIAGKLRDRHDMSWLAQGQQLIPDEKQDIGGSAQSNITKSTGSALLHSIPYPSIHLSDQNPPCNTLYIGNLPPDVSEEELKDLFSAQPDYKRLCFRTKANGPMCFVEFTDTASATRALRQLQGFRLRSDLEVGIQPSYSKNPLGVRTMRSADGAPRGISSQQPVPGSFSLPSYQRYTQLEPLPLYPSRHSGRSSIYSEPVTPRVSRPRKTERVLRA
ncbi:hypothetical protein BX600DRAFT_441022 [Xylariales sp. PMI_506]|nr:hypothetical protein BX600DRAFT_441022 [Xylariales sp. PMI_506]